jgi:hypothetical protein
VPTGCARRARHDHLLLDQAVGDAQLLGRVPDADVDRVLDGPLKSPLAQPDRQPGATAGGVDHQVGGHESVRRVEHHTGDPLRGRVEPRCADRPLPDGHVRQPGRVATDLPLQLRPARDVSGERLLQLRRYAEHVSGRAEVDRARLIFQNRHARRDHVVEQSGKQCAELLRAARHQDVHVPALRHRRAVRGPLRQGVAIEQRHLVIEIRQHPARAQARDAGADDDRMFPSPHHGARLCRATIVHGARLCRATIVHWGAEY